MGKLTQFPLGHFQDFQELCQVTRGYIFFSDLQNPWSFRVLFGAESAWPRIVDELKRRNLVSTTYTIYSGTVVDE